MSSHFSWRKVSSVHPDPNPVAASPSKTEKSLFTIPLKKIETGNLKNNSFKEKNAVDSTTSTNSTSDSLFHLVNPQTDDSKTDKESDTNTTINSCRSQLSFYDVEYNREIEFKRSLATISMNHTNQVTIISYNKDRSENSMKTKDEDMCADNNNNTITNTHNENDNDDNNNDGASNNDEEDLTQTLYHNYPGYASFNRVEDYNHKPFEQLNSNHKHHHHYHLNQNNNNNNNNTGNGNTNIDHSNFSNREPLRIDLNCIFKQNNRHYEHNHDEQYNNNNCVMTTTTTTTSNNNKDISGKTDANTPLSYNTTTESPHHTSHHYFHPTESNNSNNNKNNDNNDNNINNNNTNRTLLNMTSQLPNSTTASPLPPLLYQHHHHHHHHPSATPCNSPIPLPDQVSPSITHHDCNTITTTTTTTHNSSNKSSNSSNKSSNGSSNPNNSPDAKTSTKKGGILLDINTHEIESENEDGIIEYKISIDGV